MNSDEDVVNAKSIGAQQLTTNVRCVMMTQALFKARDEFDQVEHQLYNEVAKLKDDLKDRINKAEEVVKQLVG